MGFEKSGAPVFTPTKHKLFLFSKIIMLFIFLLIQGLGQVHLLGRWLVLLWIRSVMYIVYKMWNGLVVFDLEWVLKVHVTFIQELEIVIIENLDHVVKEYLSL